MKAKELLKESLEQQDCEGIKMRSIAFEHFLISMADILVMDSLWRIKGEPVGLKDFESNTFTVKDVHAILCHEDILLGLQQAHQLRGFIDWFLEQDINVDDGRLWYDLDYLAKKWNEFALEAIA